MTIDIEPLPPFAHRHIGPSSAEQTDMLRTIGAASLADLLGQTLPANIRQRDPLDLGPALSEMQALALARSVGAQNVVMTSLIGQGYYGTVLPPVIQRNVLESPAWYTAYTPYQPEISQGRLEALLNFQTVVADLTGLEIANASLLDEGTAAAEAMGMAHRISATGREAFFVDRDCHPQTIAVVQTRAEALGWEVRLGCPMRDLDALDLCGAIFQYPGSSGNVPDLRAPIVRLREAGAIAIVAADPLALTLLKSPGELGADIAVGSMQRFGVPMGYGGPHAAYIATRDAHKRALPGRIVGVSVDSRGNPAYRLALQTREQHIRREKATSNICTAQVLLAVVASMYAVYHGPEGLTAIARRIRDVTSVLGAGLATLGFSVRPKVFFDTLTVEVGVSGRTDPGAGAGTWPATARHRLAGGSDSDRHQLRRDDHAGRGGKGVVRLRRHAGSGGAPPRRSGSDQNRSAGYLAAHGIVPGATGLSQISFGDRAAAIHAAAVRSRPGARPLHDPARLLHHETQCHGGNDAADLAGIFQPTSFRAG